MPRMPSCPIHGLKRLLRLDALLLSLVHLLELVDLIAEKMVDGEHGCGRNQFDLAFNPIPAIAIRRTWNAERLGEAAEGTLVRQLVRRTRRRATRAAASSPGLVTTNAEG